MGRGNSLTTRVAQSGFSLQRDCAETELLNLVLASDFELDFEFPLCFGKVNGEM